MCKLSGPDAQTTSNPPCSDLESSQSSYGGSENGGSDDESVQHKLGFKCIGAAHEKPHQAFLTAAERKLHKDKYPVQVNFRPEPTNERDNNAIAIDMDFGTGWFHVGYIASSTFRK